MGVIISSVKEVENIIWTDLRKARIYDAKRVMMFGDNAAIIELNNGAFTCVGRHHGPNRYALLGYGLDAFSQSVLNGLVKLGILNKKQVQEHITSTRETERKRERKFAIMRIRELADEFKIELPEIPE